MKDVSQGLRELRVGHGPGCGEVNWTGEFGIGQRIFDGAEFVIHTDPTHPLLTARQLASHACFKQGKLLAECSAGGIENNAGA